GNHLHWSGDSKTLYWSLGAELYQRDLSEAFAFVDGAPEELPEPVAEGKPIGFSVTADVPTGSIAFTGARLITMRGDEVIENGTIVVEAGKRSGSLITARIAAEDHGREVMALPGRVDSRASEGSLDLIKKGGAALVTDPADVIELLETPARHCFQGTHESRYVGANQLFEVKEPDRGEDRGVGSLTAAQRTILDTLDIPMTMDELSSRTGFAPESIRAEITMLEIQRRVVREGSRIAKRRR
ncbi:MAG: DNA-processing protein DprA, partial [Planctomycetes bacterium]|nr:DNA-processing protein DprA [Planctomycetota bacterium]